jgi:hypothetical protein
MPALVNDIPFTGMTMEQTEKYIITLADTRYQTYLRKL